MVGLEDVSQLSRQFHREARVTKKVVNFKPFWWWSAAMGRITITLVKSMNINPCTEPGLL